MNTSVQSENKYGAPRWNLDAIYPSLDSDAYKNDVAAYTRAMDALDTLLAAARAASADFDFCAWLASYLKADNECASVGQTLNTYASCLYATDTTNTVYLNNMSRIEEMGLRAEQQDIAFSTLLAAHADAVPEFCRTYPECQSYKYILNETVEETHHLMSAAEENLASDLERTGGDAWGRLQEQIISNLDDEKTGKTFNELRNDALSPDPALRKSSYETEKALLRQNEIAFAASLNNIKGWTVTLNKRRNWNTALDRALFGSRMSRASLDALLSAVEESLPQWRVYLQTKAAVLRKTGATASVYAGTEKEPGLAFYDLFAPLPGKNGTSGADSLLTRTWTFEETHQYIVEKFSNFSPAMGNFADNAFRSGWIDAEVRPGKVGGAFDEDFPKGHQSRILSNFTGAFGDVVTLAHETGHAYHFSCLNGKDPVFFGYPMTLAETASTFAETIVKQDAIAHTTGAARTSLIELELQDVCQVLVDILCRFYFERSVFEERAHGELAAEDFCRLMRDAQEKSYGAGLSSERHEYMWAVKSHYYSTGIDFYNFPYAFGQLFAAGLYERSLREGPSFAGTYATLLADTGSMSCEELCRRAGFDITDKAFWKSGIAMYEQEINAFTGSVR